MLKTNLFSGSLHSSGGNLMQTGHRGDQQLRRPVTTRNRQTNPNQGTKAAQTLQLVDAVTVNQPQTKCTTN